MRGIFLFIVFNFITIAVIAQKDDYAVSRYFDDEIRGDKKMRIGFYNVENLFDPFDDPDTRDDWFTPEGEYRHTWNRYQAKLQSLAKVITAMGGWEPIEVLGLCEVENLFVLEGLTQQTMLKNFGYKIIHKDSPDSRGIDVAMIYRPEKFRPLHIDFKKVTFPHAPDRKTRDILYVKGVAPNSDTLHVVVNHWPSRYGGQMASEPGRFHTATMVRALTDSLFAQNQNANIIITGDFNDHPDDKSLTRYLKALPDSVGVGHPELVNLMYKMMYKTGTHAFGGKWGILDMFIVSTALVRGNNSTRVIRAQVFDMPFLIQEGAGGTTRPWRTYQGPAYLGGFSDHLPIILDLDLTIKLADL
ncbi:MAG: endonuclease/exonuclease/phosphatase family protein [Luteibaculaceae bacterium]